MLTEPITVSDWVEYDTSGDDMSATVADGHPLSVYHLNSVLNNPTAYAERPATRIFGVQETVELFTAHLLGVVAQEPSHILKRGGIYSSYATRTIKRLKEGQDSGLLHPEAMDIYDSLSDVEKSEVSTLISDVAEKLEYFPTIGKMNVVFTNETVSVDVGPTILSMIIPVMVETRSGLAAIIPTTASIHSDKDLFATAEASLHVMGTIRGADIAKVYLWDVAAERARSVPVGGLDKAVTTIASMCRR